MELDTAVRHILPLLRETSLNGGWTADPEHNKPGRDLGYTRYDRMAGRSAATPNMSKSRAIRPALTPFA